MIKTTVRDDGINGEVFHISVIFSRTSLEEQRETTLESLRGTGYGTYKKRTRDKRKRRGARLIHSCFHERERETVFTSVHRHYGNLARIRNVGLR